MKLRDYELLESEWETVKQLRDSLKVRVKIIYIHYYNTNRYLDFQDCNPRIFDRYTLCSRRHSRHG